MFNIEYRLYKLSLWFYDTVLYVTARIDDRARHEDNCGDPTTICHRLHWWAEHQVWLLFRNEEHSLKRISWWSFVAVSVGVCLTVEYHFFVHLVKSW